MLLDQLRGPQCCVRRIGAGAKALGQGLDEHDDTPTLD